MAFSNQLVVLVGGRGTRLGDAAKQTPKPLMPINDQTVFLDYFLRSSLRQGFTEVLLLAGHLAEQIRARYDGIRIGEARISVHIEQTPMGTGGALKDAYDRLAPTFIVANGDTLFDTNIRAIDHILHSHHGLQGVLGLRHVPDARRYGSVEIVDSVIKGFREKAAAADPSPGLVSGGIYAIRRAALDSLPAGPSSIETDLFPHLAAAGQLGGISSKGYFLDIGLPETLALAQKELPAQSRPALFLDRDGVINIDKGYVGRIEDFEWVEGADRVIRKANDRGLAVIVITNQAGVARGFYTEGDVLKLHRHIQESLNSKGAFIDSFYYCPYHEAATVERYRIANHPGRKPNPGMILHAAQDHNIDLSKSHFIGDQPTDTEAARRAGVKAHLFAGGSLISFVENTCEIFH